MTITTDLQSAAAHYDALATALKAKYYDLTAEFDGLLVADRDGLPGLIIAAMANGVQTALHTAQSQLALVLADMAPERDL